MFGFIKKINIFKRKKKPYRVLVACDFEGDFKSLEGCKRYDFDIRFCEKNGEVILSELTENPVDLVVMDALISGVDAEGVLNRFKYYLAPSAVPSAIVVSSFDNARVASAFKKAGAFDYITTSFDAATLLQKVDEIEAIKHENKFWAIANSTFGSLMVV